MVIAHTNDKPLLEKIKALQDFTVLESAKGLLIHGNTDQIKEQVGTLAAESGAWLGLEIYDKGTCTKTAFNDSFYDCDKQEEIRVPAQETVTEEERDAMTEDAPLIEEADDSIKPETGPETPKNAEATTEAEPVVENEPTGIESSESEDKSSEDDDTEKAAPESPGKTDAPKDGKKNQKLTFSDAKEREIPPLMPVPGTSFTAEEAIAKLEAERPQLSENDQDARWVMTELQNKCREDHDLCQYVMRKGKTFLGAYEYFAKLARDRQIGIVMEKLGGVSISRESSMPYFIEYFKLDDDEIARRKKEKEEKAKAEREAKAAKKGKKDAKKAAKTDTKAVANPGLLEGIQIPETPKAETPKPAKPAESPAPKAESKDEKKPANEQMDLFSLIGMAV